MSRRRKAEVRRILPDAKYNSVLIARFINRLMYDGKRSKAEGIFYSSMNVLQEKLGKEPVAAFKEAIDNVKPELEVKSRRVGGATYQVPMEVRSERQVTLAMRWLINAARARSGKSMAEKLTNELVDAVNNTGAAVRKKEEMHRMAEGNKAFAHYRW